MQIFKRIIYYQRGFFQIVNRAFPDAKSLIDFDQCAVAEGVEIEADAGGFFLSHIVEGAQTQENGGCGFKAGREGGKAHAGVEIKSLYQFAVSIEAGGISGIFAAVKCGNKEVAAGGYRLSTEAGGEAVVDLDKSDFTGEIQRCSGEAVAAVQS